MAQRRNNSKTRFAESLRGFLARRPVARDLSQILAALLLLCLPLSFPENARNANGGIRKSFLDSEDTAPLCCLTVEPCRPQTLRATGRDDGNSSGNGRGALQRSRVNKTGAHDPLAFSAALLLLAACAPYPEKGRTRHPHPPCIVKQRLAKRALPVRAGP
jgi:hypothetical protein